MSMCVTQCHTVSHSVYVSMHVPARMSVCVCAHVLCAGYADVCASTRQYVLLLCLPFCSITFRG